MVVVSPKNKKLSAGKWLPKSPTGDKSIRYTRDAMLHYLITVMGTPMNMQDFQHIFCVPLVKKESDPVKESKRQKIAKRYSSESLTTGIGMLNDSGNWSLPSPNSGVNQRGVQLLNMVMGGAPPPSPPPSQEMFMDPSYLDIVPPPPGPSLNDLWGEFFWLDPAWAMPMAPITTVELRNVPPKYTPAEIVDNIKNHPFGKEINFLYLPPDPKQLESFGTEDSKITQNLGVAIINFNTQQDAQNFANHYNNKKCKHVMNKHPSARTMAVGPARVQGLEWNLEELRRDQILERLGDESSWRPFLFEDGKPTPFTVSIKQRRLSDMNKHNKSQPVDPKKHTTIMIRNIPNKYTRQMLHDRLINVFKKTDYDFIYMPIDFNNKCNVGYAFVNFRNEGAVELALKTFHMVECQTALPGFNSSKIVEMTPARVQGLQSNIEHLQQSTVLDQLRENDDWTPLIFDENGDDKPFPYDNPKKKRKSNQSRSTNSRKRPSQISAPNEYIGMTTLIVENIPEKINRDQLMKAFDAAGFKQDIDFIHLPGKKGVKNKHGGLAHVNLRRPKALTMFMERFNDKEFKEFISDFKGNEKATIVPSKLQGYHNNIQHLKENDLLDEKGILQPLIFDTNGDRIDCNLAVSSPLRADAPVFNPVVGSDSKNAEVYQSSITIATVREQIEYYFSDTNLAKDQFLKEQMDKDGFVTCEFIKTFPKLKRNIDATIEIIQKTVEQSPMFDTKGQKFRLADSKNRRRWTITSN